MTERGTWKASERRMATLLGGERIPVTGRERGHAPDIDGVTVAGRRLAIEHKYGAKVLSARVHEAFVQAKAATRSTSDIPIVTIEETSYGYRNTRVVIMDAGHFASIVEWYEKQLDEALKRAEKADTKCHRCGGRIIIEQANCIACGRQIG